LDCLGQQHGGSIWNTNFMKKLMASAALLVILLATSAALATQQG
jgi:hypothetical protein